MSNEKSFIQEVTDKINSFQEDYNVKYNYKEKLGNSGILNAAIAIVLENRLQEKLDKIIKLLEK